MNDWQSIKDQCPNLYREGVVFECGPGWFNLIQELSLKLEKLIKANANCVDIYASQVKEKYGTLRFYMSCENDEMTKIIEKYEGISSKTCEVCGNLGTHRVKTWSEVRCDKCFKE